MKRKRSQAARIATMHTCFLRNDAIHAMRKWLWAKQRGKGVREALAALEAAARAYLEPL